MVIDKYNIEYSKINYKNKSIFIFVNHKTAVICWAKVKEQFKEDLDVVTFDSHGDFHGGVINGEDFSKSDLAFGSKHLTHLQHFSKCEEFLNWNLLDNLQNSQFIKQDKKFLFVNNDNFIDVTFMKDVIKDVFWYPLNVHGNAVSGKCEDFNDKNHLFIKSNIKKFKSPSKPFILDIDLDFFVKNPALDSTIISVNTIKKYLKLQKNLFSNELCKGLTLALEPDCCGGIDNCLIILKKLGIKFELDLISESKKLIKRAEKI
ncbi:MAG: UPF0489 family protein [archaeon]|nr:UPF0489 family protein [archaeon]